MISNEESYFGDKILHLSRPLWVSHDHTKGADRSFHTNAMFSHHTFITEIFLF